MISLGGCGGCRLPATDWDSGALVPAWAPRKSAPLVCSPSLSSLAWQPRCLWPRGQLWAQPSQQKGCWFLQATHSARVAFMTFALFCTDFVGEGLYRVCPGLNQAPRPGDTAMQESRQAARAVCLPALPSGHEPAGAAILHPGSLSGRCGAAPRACPAV